MRAPRNDCNARLGKWGFSLEAVQGHVECTRRADMWNKLWKEIAARRLYVGVPPVELTTEAELAALPPAARSYMAFYGVTPSTPKHWSFCMGWKGRFRMAKDRPWMPIEAVQYDMLLPVARIFHMRARMGGILPVLARDTYAGGHGRMLAKVAGLVTVADREGPEFDQGELVTWLNDCVLFAPSMLLDPRTHWSHVDATTFDVTFSDEDTTVTGRVFLDERGAPVDFETRDRFLGDPDDPSHPLIRGQWSTPIQTWERVRGQWVPTRARATWHLASGDLTYAEFDLTPGSLAFDVQPLVASRAA